MARTASPWYWERRSCWAVILSGQRHVLGNHPDDTPPPRKKKNRWVVPKAIQDAYDDLKVQLRTGAAVAPPVLSPAPLVAELFDEYLEWCQKHRSPRTYEWSRRHIQSFLNSLAEKQLTAEALKPFHVQQWADGKTTWGANHRRGAITAVQRAFSWAEQMGHIVKSPIRRIEKPAPKRREQVLTPAEFRTLIAHVKDAAFRDVLTFCWETGARVQEVRLIRAEHCRPGTGRVEIPPPEAKGKKRWRVIYLTEAAEAIVSRLSGQHQAGPIFRNRRGNPWDAQNFNCRFCRLSKKLGTKYALTAIRHSFATRLLEAGIDHVTVAALLGHVDAAMLSRVYSHVGAKSDFLLDQLRKAGGAAAAQAALKTRGMSPRSLHASDAPGGTPR